MTELVLPCGESIKLTADSADVLHSLGHLDGDFDNSVSNPEAATGAKDSQPSPPARVTRKGLIYSAGPDRDPKTWKDNIRTW